ncbi:MAG: class I SAM-dependent methyltransferase [bacterium]
MNNFNFLINDINHRIAQSLPYKGRVIDLGCGTAPYKKYILKVADKYIGVDWKSSFHDQSNVDVFCDLSKQFPFEDNCADTIVSFQVIEHLPEPGSFLAECYRILRPGGRLFFTAPFMWHIHEAPYDYYRYTRYGFIHLLEKSGFVNIKVHENTGFWQMWVLKFNYHTSHFTHGLLKYLLIPIWYIGQIISPILDKYDSHPQETASYTAFASKP